jgi:hypothetical protein
MKLSYSRGKFENAIKKYHSIFSIRNELIYKYDTGHNFFWAGNEFLYFENNLSNPSTIAQE